VTVALCLPSGDMIHTDTAMSIWALMAYQREIIVINPRTSMVEVSRYKMVKQALERGASHVFQVDSDLTFPHDSLARLLAHDLPIVGATYMKRRLPYEVIGIPMKDGITSSDTGLTEMVRMPVGFSLIKAEVFEKVPRPWFPVSWSDERQEHTSEDYGFCDLARAADYRLWCDLDLTHDVGHIGMNTFRWTRPTEDD
jgi:hypothetical protein